MNPRPLVAALLSLALLLAATSAHAQQQEGQSQIIERVVVVVNDEAVFLSEIRRRAIPFLQRALQAATTDAERQAAAREVLRQVADHIVEELLIGQAARKAQVHVTREDVDRAVRSVQHQNHLTDEQFWQAVRDNGFTDAGYREDVRRQITRLRLLNERLRGRVSISEDDIRSEYNHALRDARGQSTFVAEDILVPVPEGSTATEIAEVRHQAEALRSHLTQSEWDAAMTEHAGVALGTLHQGQLDRPLEDVLLALQPGQIGAPVRNAAGFHILFLRSRSAGAGDIPAYEDAKTAIYQRLLEREMSREETSFTADLKRQATIVWRMQF